MKRSFILFISALFCLPILAQDDERARVMIETDSGNITLELYNETPLHRDNFLKLAEEGFYDGTTFHRVIEAFMIQGGDPNTKEGKEGVPGNGGPGYTIPAEFNPTLYHQKGALCAARKGDNVNPEQASSGSQFYIVQGRTFSAEQLQNFEVQVNNAIRNRITRSFFMAEENKDYLMRIKKAQKEGNQDEVMAVMEEVEPIIEARMGEKAFSYSEDQLNTYQTIGGTPHLDMQYTVFGQVIEGMEVIDKVASVEKNGERPTSPMRMTVRVLD
jgi:peptidyl-prolyl cis-trans isomerase B (cyclophilin B)